MLPSAGQRTVSSRCDAASRVLQHGVTAAALHQGMRVQATHAILSRKQVVLHVPYRMMELAIYQLSLVKPAVVVFVDVNLSSWRAIEVILTGDLRRQMSGFSWRFINNLPLSL